METKYTKQVTRDFKRRFISVVPMIAVFAPLVSTGQSADIFASDPSQKSSDTAEATDAPPEAEPVDAQPSRFAGEDTEPYIRARAAIFSMRNRTTDPFGLNQDPNVKPVINNNAVIKQRRQAALPPTPLSDIVKQIRVTTIMPGENKFLVGVRVFAEGDEFPLVYRGKMLQVRITEVSAQQIIFKNIATEEIGRLQADVLPPGMIAGGGNSRPAGMISNDKDTPLDLGSSGGFDHEN